MCILYKYAINHEYRCYSNDPSVYAKEDVVVFFPMCGICMVQSGSKIVGPVMQYKMLYLICNLKAVHYTAY